MSRFALAGSFSVLLAVPLVAQSNAEESAPIYEVETPLQRLLLRTFRVPESGIAVLVPVDPGWFVHGAKLDVAALTKADYSTRLRSKGDHASAMAQFWFRQLEDTDGDAVSFLAAGLEHQAERAGFPKTTSVFWRESRTWQEDLDSVGADLVRLAPGPEESTTWEEFEAFAVSSPLSRLLTHHADVVVHLYPTVQEGTLATLVPKLEGPLTEWLATHPAIARNRLQFFFTRSADCNSLSTEPLEELSRRLGFPTFGIDGPQESSYGSFAPGPAPDFVLDSLQSGKATAFHDLVDGKVALLTFWGVG